MTSQTRTNSIQFIQANSIIQVNTIIHIRTIHNQFLKNHTPIITSPTIPSADYKPSECSRNPLSMASKMSTNPINVLTLLKTVLIKWPNMIIILRPSTSKTDSQKTKEEPTCDEKLKRNINANNANTLSRPFSELSKSPSESRVLPTTEKSRER